MALVAVMAVEACRDVPAVTAAVEMVVASASGAAFTAFAESKIANPLAPMATPRLEKNSRKRSTARLTRFCAASSLKPSALPTVRKSWFLK